MGIDNTVIFYLLYQLSDFKHYSQVRRELFHEDDKILYGIDRKVPFWPEEDTWHGYVEDFSKGLKPKSAAERKKGLLKKRAEDILKVEKQAAEEGNKKKVLFTEHVYALLNEYAEKRYGSNRFDAVAEGLKTLLKEIKPELPNDQLEAIKSKNLDGLLKYVIAEAKKAAEDPDNRVHCTENPFPPKKKKDAAPEEAASDEKEQPFELRQPEFQAIPAPVTETTEIKKEPECFALSLKELLEKGGTEWIANQLRKLGLEEEELDPDSPLYHQIFLLSPSGDEIVGYMKLTGWNKAWHRYVFFGAPWEDIDFDACREEEEDDPQKAITIGKETPYLIVRTCKLSPKVDTEATRKLFFQRISAFLLTEVEKGNHFHQVFILAANAEEERAWKKLGFRAIKRKSFDFGFCAVMGMAILSSDALFSSTELKEAYERYLQDKSMKVQILQDYFIDILAEKGLAIDITPDWRATVEHPYGHPLKFFYNNHPSPLGKIEVCAPPNNIGVEAFLSVRLELPVKLQDFDIVKRTVLPAIQKVNYFITGGKFELMENKGYHRAEYKVVLTSNLPEEKWDFRFETLSMFLDQCLQRLDAHKSEIIEAVRKAREIACNNARQEAYDKFIATKTRPSLGGVHLEYVAIKDPDFEWDDPDEDTEEEDWVPPMILEDACIEAIDLPSDQAESIRNSLVVLKQYIKATQLRPEDILDAFDKAAVSLCEVISAMDTSTETYRMIYDDMLSPIAQLVDQGKLIEAYEMYCLKLRRLQLDFL